MNRTPSRTRPLPPTALVALRPVAPCHASVDRGGRVAQPCVAPDAFALYVVIDGHVCEVR